MKSLLLLHLLLLAVICFSMEETSNWASDSEESSSTSTSSSDSESDREQEEGSWLNHYCSCSTYYGWCSSSRRWRVCDAAYKNEMRKRSNTLRWKCNQKLDVEKERCGSLSRLNSDVNGAEKNYKFYCLQIAGIYSKPSSEYSAKKRCRRYKRPVSQCVNCYRAWDKYSQLINKANWADRACKTIEKAEKECRWATYAKAGMESTWRDCKKSGRACSRACEDVFCPKGLHKTTTAE